MQQTFVLALIGLACVTTPTFAQKKDKPTDIKTAPKAVIDNEATFSHLKFRNVGPAVVSGRIVDIEVNPRNTSTYYLAVASGGAYKTTNNGTTFEPIFDSEASYSTACITLDPNNENTLWLGTGENNNQRSVAYGDGVYKSEDGGKSWKNMGLKTSEHIGEIVVDPTNSNVVYVAAYGPLWSAGGERGIYKTTDGGKTWKQVLFVSENTGFSDIQLDKNHPEILYACAHQRRRAEWTYISGGPESAIYKSTDGGTSWDKLTKGLPAGEMGRIGLAISPVNTDVLYAIIEGEGENKGFYKSIDRGASWEKRSSWSTTGNYYQEIIADPVNIDKVYSLDTWAQVSTNGGATFKGLGEKNKHVDNHALYIDPHNTRHMMMGCDGGLYETYDNAATWQFKANLPITQFYRVALDNALPFYNIYGGTQDNSSLGGPSRTLNASGITNADWFITCGGDGFESQVDPTDPNIIYAQSQYGGLVRFDKKTGEKLHIQPQEKAGEPAYRWNWDAPLAISNFDHKRIYFAANKLFRSDDRGGSWKVISPDLTKQIDRNKLKVMGKVWSMDAVAKNQSTSIYGNITAFCESPKNEKLLYVGTDDGLLQTTEDGGTTWNKKDGIPGIPTQTPIQNIIASQHTENLVYAILNNHRAGDFKPYVMKSTDKGKTWTSISANLPVRGSAYCLAEDHVNPDLLFVGTEFGVYFTLNGGKNWMQIKGGMPTICVRDMAIQKRENDLVLASFGKGFFVLDDYSLLQRVKKEDFENEATLFAVKDAFLYIPATPLGHTGKSFQGASYYTAPNPAIGSTIYYYLKKEYKTLKDIRKEKEKQRMEKGLDVFYPSADSIRLEDNEAKAFVVCVITDKNGNLVRKLKAEAKKGMHTLVWDGRYAATTPVSFYTPNPDNPYEDDDKGYFAMPGEYTAQLYEVSNKENEEVRKIGNPVSFKLKSLGMSSIPVQDVAAVENFNKELAGLRRVVGGTDAYIGEMSERLKYIEKALLQSTDLGVDLNNDVHKLKNRLHTVTLRMHGDRSLASREFETLPGIMSTIDGLAYGAFNVTAQQSGAYTESLQNAKMKFGEVYTEVKQIAAELATLEKQLEQKAMPYTPGRLPAYSNH